MPNNVRFPYIKSNRTRLYRALSNVFHLSLLLMKRVFMKKVSTLKAVNCFLLDYTIYSGKGNLNTF